MLAGAGWRVRSATGRRRRRRATRRHSTVRTESRSAGGRFCLCFPSGSGARRVGSPDAATPRSSLAADHDRGSPRAVRASEWRRLATLGLPTFGMALAITTVSSYLPVVAHGFTSSTTVIGVFIGGEGLAALCLPIIVGSWSDRIRTPIGGRLPFLLAGTPVMIVGLAVLGAAGSLLVIGIGLAAFFCGYFTAYEPYRALYPDLVPDAISSRAQSTQAIWRGAGTGLALFSGGWLLSVADFWPFASAATILALSVGVFGWLLLRGGVGQGQGKNDSESAREVLRRVRRLLGSHPALRAYVIANSLWELSLARAQDVHRPLCHSRARLQARQRLADHRRGRDHRARRGIFDRRSRGSLRTPAGHARGPLGLRPLAAGPRPDDRDADPARGDPGDRNRRGDGDVLALLAADPPDARGGAWDPDRHLQRQPRGRDAAWATACWAGDPAARAGVRLDPGLCGDVAGDRCRDPDQHRADGLVARGAAGSPPPAWRGGGVGGCDQ